MEIRREGSGPRPRGRRPSRRTAKGGPAPEVDSGNERQPWDCRSFPESTSGAPPSASPPHHRISVYLPHLLPHPGGRGESPSLRSLRHCGWVTQGSRISPSTAARPLRVGGTKGGHEGTETGGDEDRGAVFVAASPSGGCGRGPSRRGGAAASARAIAGDRTRAGAGPTRYVLLEIRRRVRPRRVEQRRARSDPRREPGVRSRTILRVMGRRSRREPAYAWTGSRTGGW